METKQELYKKYYEQETEGTRLVPTGLAGEDYYEILQSVIGQCSDGIWENSPAQEPYWRFCKVMRHPDTDAVEIRVSNAPVTNSWFRKNLINNPFLQKTDQEVKNWFCRKIKRIIKIEGEDYHEEIAFSSENKNFLRYLGNWKQTVSQAVEAYDILKG